MTQTKIPTASVDFRSGTFDQLMDEYRASEEAVTHMEEDNGFDEDTIVSAEEREALMEIHFASQHIIEMINERVEERILSSLDW